MHSRSRRGSISKLCWVFLVILNATTTAQTTAQTTATTTAKTTATVRAQANDTDVLRSRLVDIVNGLNEGALKGLYDTDDFVSYQSQAFLHLSKQVGVDDFSDEKLAQYYALYCIYHATNGVANEITETDPRFDNITMPEWTFATNWRDATDVDPCGTTVIAPTTDSAESVATTLSMEHTGGWHGVTCNSEGRVISIELYDNWLSGHFPGEIALLASDGPFRTGAGDLQTLDLYRNEFLSNGGDSSWMSDLGSNMSEYYQ